MKHFGFTVILLAVSHTCYSEILEIQALNFGTVLVINNSSQESFTVDRRGILSSTFGIRNMGDASPGLFRITELNPFSVRNVSVSAASPSMTPSIASLETFTLSIPDYDTSVRADENGEGLIRVGGRITTSGSSSLNFENATYSTQIQITIDF